MPDQHNQRHCNGHDPDLGSRPETILACFLEHARPEILRQFQPDSCIISTRITQTVLQPCGFTVQPLSVLRMILNAAFVARLARGEPFPASRAVTLEWAATPWQMARSPGEHHWR